MTKNSSNTGSVGRGDRHRRDLAILWHLADGPSVYAFISRLYFNDCACGHIIKRLADEGLVEIHKRALPGGVTLVGITARGVRLLGDVPEERAKLPKGARLDALLATRWVCLFGSTRKYIVHAADFRPVFGDKGPAVNAIHIASSRDESNGRGHPAIERTYFASSSAQAGLKQLRTTVDEALISSVLRPWVESGDYLFRAFTSDESKVVALKHVLERCGLDAFVKVSLAPGANTLSGFLKKRKPKK